MKKQQQPKPVFLGTAVSKNTDEIACALFACYSEKEIRSLCKQAEVPCAKYKADNCAKLAVALKHMGAFVLSCIVKED